MPRLAVLLAAFAFSTAIPVAAQAQAKGAADHKAALPAPKGLWAAQTDPRTVTLVWTRMPGATAYEILGRTADGVLVNLGRVGATVERYVLGQAAIARLAAERLELAIRGIGAGGAQGALGSFNPVVLEKQAATKAAVAPANVQVEETSPGVLTVRWDEVPGATAYAIGRAMGTSGLQRRCDLCPTGGTFVDTVPAAGVRYSYGIVAITPGGTSRRTISEWFTPGGAVAAADGDTGSKGGTGTATTSDVDPKSLAAGVAITATLAGPGPAQPLGGGLIKAITRLLVTIRPLASNVASMLGLPNVTATLMRAVCGGPFEAIATAATTQLIASPVGDAIDNDVLSRCSAKDAVPVTYKLRITNGKGGTAETEPSTVMVPKPQGTAPTNDPKGRSGKDRTPPRPTEPPPR